jgi:UDP-N-acetylmuramate dehydrogenase
MKVNGDALLKQLPRDVRGKLLPDVRLADQTWFHVGGPAEVLFKPADEEDLAMFLSKCPPEVPITVIGIASNLLVRDGGVPGVVIRLGPAFGQVQKKGDHLIAGSAAVDLNVSRAAQAEGIAGMEFLSGIPGTIGGGLRMNAGAYGREFKDIVIEATALMRDGSRKVFKKDEIGFAYRHTNVPDDCIFVSALLEGTGGDPKFIQQRMNDIQKERTATQPIREKTGGSTFANPENDPKNRKAWQLIEAVGCRGLKIGQAQVSEKHCNFLINTGHATAADIEALGDIVQRRVNDKFGVMLRWEIKRIGVNK